MENKRLNLVLIMCDIQNNMDGYIDTYVCVKASVGLTQTHTQLSKSNQRAPS